jgi:cell division protease FtsH
VRAGRLDRLIAIELPSIEDLPQIIKFHLKDDAAAIGDLSSVASQCVGSSGADIEKLVRAARRIARDERRTSRCNDLVRAIEAAAPKMTDEDRGRIAIHEAGHAVATLRLGLSESITISIVPNKGSLGHMAAILENCVPTLTVINNLLTMLLAGRAAENVILQETSGGAGGSPNSDLAQATELACLAVAKLGLSKSGSVLWHGLREGESIAAYPGYVVAEVDQMVGAAFERACQLIDAERIFVERIAKALISRKALSHKDLIAIDKACRPWFRSSRPHPLQGTLMRPRLAPPARPPAVPPMDRSK